ncbi:MAG: DegT/DnrJ/EryC1/StrS family aminotransferase [Deltaproteobacteria bacterium]|nr:DegT/DnrJ/EryC1/StrS family aminotransferase [Deltaproteobacteria bacterium]
MKVPYFGVDRQYKNHREQYLAIADRVWSTGKVLQGADVAELEEKVRTICNRRHGVAVGSCTDALAFSMEALNIGAGDEVLVTGYSFFASVSQIVRVGATPVFVDIDPDYYMMNLKAAESLITPRTKAILAVHMFGQTLNLTEVEMFAANHNLILLEDAAQSIGAYDGKRPAGSLGVGSSISFDPTKVINSFSSAGIFVCDDDDLANTVRMMRYHGKSPETKGFEILGYNSQLANDMAGMLSFKVDHLTEWNGRRNEVAAMYTEGLKNVTEVTVPKRRPGSTHNFHKYVLQAKNRDGLAAALKSQGIETMVHYSKPLCDEGMIKKLNLPAAYTNVPVARMAASAVISLPVFPELTQEEVQYVVDSIKAFYAKN